MKTHQSAALERKKFFADPLMVFTILLLIVLLMLFILYPLAMLLLDSVYVQDTALVPLESVLSGGADVPYSKDGASVTILDKKGKAATLTLEELSGSTGYLFAKNGRALKEGEEVNPAETYVKVKNNSLTLAAFPRIFADYTFKRAFTNTLVLGLITGFGSVIIGLLFAYVDCYVNVRSRVTRKMFDVVSTLPVVSPPFVLSLSMILLFGRGGLITRKLLGIYDSDVYGLSGIAIVQILTFFPVCYMMLKGLLKNIDPSMEEAARNMGAGRWKVFTTVTLPLMLPGLGNAFLVTFIESVADFANPMMIGGSYDTLATTIYLRITGGSYDTNGAAAMAVVLLCITLVLFLIQKYYLEKKTAATLTGKASRARTPIDDRSVRVPLVTICSVISAFVIMMYIAIPFGALFKLWGRDYSLSLKWFQQLFRDDGFKAFKDSFVLSLIASPITALLSMIISYLVVKKKFRAKGFIEFVSMLAMAVPGTVLGVGYIRGFAGGIFRTGFMQGIYGTGIILVIVFVVRSLPVGTRSGISALRQIDKSIEESAYDLGAGSGRVFMTVTLPLIKDSFFSGLVTTFVRSITAISAVILLVTPRYLLITCRINEFAEKGAYGVACAYATILIIITYAAIVLMNWVIRHFGTSKQMRVKEGD
ncbi:MAG: iron ABC transporter permease [Clostridiales bacterium]|nr:iron ABC transporter permease [Clostridiales bacterium]